MTAWTNTGYSLERGVSNRQDVGPDAWFGTPWSDFHPPSTCGGIDFNSCSMSRELLISVDPLLEDPARDGTMDTKADFMFPGCFRPYNPPCDASLDTNAAMKKAKQSYAKPEDWGPVRPIITELYDRLPLRAVMGEMEQRGFFASEKMYKYRIEQWGLNKKLKARDVEGLLGQLERCRDSGRSIDTILRKGRPVNWQRVGRYLKRNKKLALLTTSVSLPYTADLDAPDEHRLLETLSLVFEQYVAGSIRPGGWSIPYSKGILFGRHGVSGLDSLFAWSDDILQAVILIGRKQLGQGFQILHACLDGASRKFRDEDPHLHQELLTIVIGLRMQDAKIAGHVAGFFRQLARIVFPSRHPIALFWQRWDQIQAHSPAEIFRVTIRPFARGLCDATPSGGLEFVCFLCNYFRTLFICSGGATPELRSIERELRDHLDRMTGQISEDHACGIYLRLQLANTLLSLGDYVGAKTILEETAELLGKKYLDSSSVVMDIWDDWDDAVIVLFGDNKQRDCGLRVHLELVS